MTTNGTVVVSGAAGGMGAVLCTMLIHRGYRVVGLEVDTDRLQSFMTELNSEAFIGMVGDVGSEEFCSGLVPHLEALEPVVGLVNLAGISQGSDILEITDEDWARSLDVNLSAPMKLSRLLIPYMKAGGGSIVNVSSPVGFIGARKVSYSASKAGLLGLTMTTARNVGKYNIRCNLVIPGTCITYMTHDWSIEKQISIGQESFLGRLCTPEEVAKAICFLLSSEASYMTGSVLDLTAGSMVGH